MKEFKELRGQRILLSLPPKDEGKLIVDENTREALHKEMLEKMKRLTVYEVGSLVSDIKPGDEVLVNPESLRTGYVINVGADGDKVLINVLDIVLVW
jgi:hypothetical protein